MEKIPSAEVLGLRERFERTGKPLFVNAPHGKKVLTVKFSPQGTKLAVGCSDGTVFIHPAGSAIGSYEQEFSGCRGGITQIAWSPIEEHRLVVLSYDRTLRLLDLKSRKPVEVFKLNNSKSGKDWVSAAWSDDGQYLAALDEGDNLSLIDPRKGKVLKEKQLRQEAMDLVWTPDSQHVLVCGAGSSSYLELHRVNFKPESKTVTERLWSSVPHTSTASTLKIDAKQRYLALGSTDGLVSIWDLRELIPLRTSDRVMSSVRHVDISHDSNLIAVASDESFVDIVDVQTGQQVWEVRPTEDAPITSISWHPKRLSLALACERQSDYKGFYVLNADRS